LYVIKQYLIARREDISQIIAAVCQKWMKFMMN
jgi:hypothetical protein